MRSMKAAIGGLLALGAIAGTLAFGIDDSTATPAGKCQTVGARITSDFTTAGCTNPLGCLEGTIDGGGALNGATFFTFFDAAPSAGIVGVPVTKLSYLGFLTITTQKGTLNLTNLGILDPDNLVFAEVDLVTGGSGDFAGNTGNLLISGFITGGGSRLEGQIHGELCQP